MITSVPPAPPRNGVVVNNDGSNIHVTMPGKAVGWGAVEDAVRADDERQVQSCKEDIDSLLTFAGLYSAALTALLALSFNMLQEDVAGESLQVLRQIAQQTARYQLSSSGVLNTTALVPPMLVSPFQPSRGALRVNILWFTSLVFSLSTASIGILVKQWLRAYISYRTSSAQGRMRVRHFRRQGMEVWKVYEIAAVLPFFIQLALGLFFIGLCYFTAEVHPDLGHATLPLVAGWALFIFIVTILPIVSSHCPYKPALFESLFSVIRPRLFSSIEITFVVIDRLTRWPFFIVTQRFYIAVSHMRTLRRQLLGSLFSSAGSYTAESFVGIEIDGVYTIRPRPTRAALITGRIWGPDSYLVTISTKLKQRLTPDNPPDTVLKGSFFGRVALRARQHTRYCANSSRPFDETDAVTFAGKDVNILVSADALQSDDELLGTAIADALKQSQPTLKDTAILLLGALQSRGIPSDGRQLDIDGEATLLDCRSLTLRARDAIVDIVAQTPGDVFCAAFSLWGPSLQFSADMRWILCILLSPSQYPLPAQGLKFLGTCILDQNSWNVREYIRKKVPFENPDQVLRLLLGAARHACMKAGSTSGAEATTVLASIVKGTEAILEPYFDDVYLPNFTWPFPVFDDHQEIHQEYPWNAVLNKISLTETANWLAESLEQELEHFGIQRLAAELLQGAMGLVFRLSAILYLSDKEGIAPTLRRLTNRTLTQGGRSVEHLRLLIWGYICQPAGVVEDAIPHWFMDCEDIEAVEHLDRAMHDIVGDLFLTRRSQYPRLCYIIVHILRHNAVNDHWGAMEYGTKLSLPALHLWRRVFRRIAVRIESPSAEDHLSLDAVRLVKKCIGWIDDMGVGLYDRSSFAVLSQEPGNIADEQEWRAQFKSAESPISNRFVFFLSRLLPDDERTELNSWRLRLLEAMTDDERLVAINDDEQDVDLEESLYKVNRTEGIGAGDLEEEVGQAEGGGAQVDLRQTADELLRPTGLDEELERWASAPLRIRGHLREVDTRMDNEASEGLYVKAASGAGENIG